MDQSWGRYLLSLSASGPRFRLIHYGCVCPSSEGPAEAGGRSPRLPFGACLTHVSSKHGHKMATKQLSTLITSNQIRGFVRTKVGSAYRIRTGDLLLEREVSSAARRMRHMTLAGEPGFEPGLVDPESTVLPLDDSPPDFSIPGETAV